MQTPALTVPQVRELIASRLAEVLGYYERETTSRRVTRWLQRNELARFYRYRQRNLLPPLKNRQRC
jgi:hypothetical protein